MEFGSLLLKFGVAPLPVPAVWYALPLRLIVGFGFVQHGYAKLSRGADDFIAILHAIGVPFADLLGWATIIVEIVGGLLILVGAFVPVAAVAMIVVLLVAIFTVHLPNGFSAIKLMSYDAAGAHFGQPGYETDLLYIAGLLALCVGGAGRLSVDGYLKARGAHCIQPVSADGSAALLIPRAEHEPDILSPLWHRRTKPIPEKHDKM
jgi:putative oxidoreductase